MDASRASARAEQLRHLFDEALDLDPEGRSAYLDQAVRDDAGLRREVEALLQAHDLADDIFRKLDHPASRLPASAYWEKLKALFEEALSRPQQQRVVFLDEVCQGNNDLRRELESLLAYTEEADAFFESLFQAIPKPVRKAGEPDTDTDPSHLTVQPPSRYQILEKLGRGGMGVVYKARDAKLGRTVALKFLPPHLSLNQEAKSRFIQEAKAASALDHPNLCTVHDIDETDDGRLFIAMAYYKGESLKERIVRGSLPLDEALDLAVQIATGLQKAHEAGIVHRDVKPANVMITEQGRVKLIDFGLAKVKGIDLTQPGTTLGTVSYMSPEQVRGEAVDHRTDLWSLGVILYEMLTGQRPFRGDYYQAVAYSILNEEPEPITARRPDIPEPLASIVEKALQKDPGARYQRAEDLLADWNLFAGKQTRSMEHLAFSSQEKRPYRWIAGASIMALLAIMVYAVVLNYRLGQDVARLEMRAVDLFYEIKEMDLQITRHERLLEEQPDTFRTSQMEDLKASRRQREDEYQGYINELGVRRELAGADEELIFQLAYIFNECELEMPASFVKAVQDEIHHYWLQEPMRSNFIEAIRRAERNGYAPYIAYTMKRYDLPPQFFYLALQESLLKVDAISERTAWGVPKGLWQLIPSTAQRYGLDVGRRPDSPTVDPEDERLDFARSTEATARYIQHIYASLAQASGLLVIGSYNWGEDRVVDKIEQLQKETIDGLPEDPRSRSYWLFLQKYQDHIPQGTKDYVIRVFAAAVIGQNPRAFGIDLDNPLEGYL